MPHKAIETMQIILLAIKRIERRASPMSTKDSLDLDCLYTALKAQCQEVVDISKLESVDMSKVS